MNKYVPRKMEILAKYQGMKLASHPCKMLLLGYKSLSRPFELRPQFSMEVVLKRRAYLLRTNNIMAGVMAKLQANPELIKKLTKTKQ